MIEFVFTRIPNSPFYNPARAMVPPRPSSVLRSSSSGVQGQASDPQFLGGGRVQHVGGDQGFGGGFSAATEMFAHVVYCRMEALEGNLAAQ